MKIGIVSAMDIEIDYLLKELFFEEMDLKKNKFFCGKYLKDELIVVATGVGKVNASTYTQVLIDTFPPNCIINIGIAGGLSDILKPLDIIIGSDYSYHDVSITQMKRLFPHTYQFQANAQLVNIFKNADFNSLTGTIVSGDKFISDNTERKNIIDTFKAIAVDMETSAMAHTCFINDMPFISIRGISDLANDKAASSYELNETIASRCVCEALLVVLKDNLIKDLSDN